MTRKGKITSVIVLILSLLGGEFLFKILNSDKRAFQSKKVSSCVVREEEKIIRGSSLSGLIEPGQIVKILFGYYDCHKIQRNDVIAYKYAGNNEPIIKIIKGLPDDEFHLQKSEKGWEILINNQVVKNSQNQNYVLDEHRYRMLSLYERDYKGIIPENAYLILGNQSGGSLDSTVFGLVGKNDIIGKVVVSE